MVYEEEKERCIDPKAGADLWINMWEELHPSTSKKYWWKWSMSKRTAEKEKKEMSHFERFATDGNEKADVLAKEGAMLDERFCGGSNSKDNAAGARRGV